MTKNLFLKPTLSFSVAGVFFVTAWHLLATLIVKSSLLLPRPNEVLVEFFSQFHALVYHGAVTWLEALGGFILGSCLGLMMALLFHAFDSIRYACYPYAVALKAVPIIGLAPLVSVWFGTGWEAKVVLGAIIAFFPVLVGSLRGLESVSDDALDLLRSMGASRTQILIKLRFPASMPFLFSGLKIASAFAVVGAIVAEFVGANSGIGFLIKQSSYYLETPLMFAAIFSSAAVGLLLFSIVAGAEALLVTWTPGELDE